MIINLEDILVASPDKGTHAAHLRAVLQILRENGLVLNRGKCEFFRSEVKFLGLRLPSDHWQRGSLPDQISAVADFLQPATIKELQAFLGAVNFYRLFKPAAAEILLPLTAVLKGAKKGAELLERFQHMQQMDFQAIKTALLQSVCLALNRMPPRSYFRSPLFRKAPRREPSFWKGPLMDFQAIITALLQSVCLALPQDNPELSLAH